jgi:perosamine synthetase
LGSQSQDLRRGVKKIIPVCVPLLNGKELEYVQDCIKTNWISGKGRYVDEFENKFSQYCGAKYGVTSSNGTTSLHLALASLGLKKGEEVIVPAFTMISPVFAIVYCRAKPVLVDAEPDTLNMDVSQIEEKITDKTKAILPVHIYGHPCDMDPIKKIARKHGLYVVEDAAEAHGAEYKGKKVGGIGEVGCFSFYANKIITCGEGGMMVTNNRNLANRAKQLRDLSFKKGEERIYLHSEIGYNYRMTNLQAAVGLAQFERIDQLVEMRRKNADLYNKMLGKIRGLKIPIEKDWAKNVYWMYSIQVEPEFGTSRNKLSKELAKRGIETRPFFIPMNKQPVFRKMILFENENYPIAEELSQKGLQLPSSPGLKKEELRHICNTIADIKKKHI